MSARRTQKYRAKVRKVAALTAVDANLRVMDESRPNSNYSKVLTDSQSSDWVSPEFTVSDDDDADDDTSTQPSIVSPILRPASSSVVAAGVATRAKAIDSELSEANWQRVVELYAEHGSPAQLSKASGLTITQVEHLLERGVMRLSLPGIRHHYSFKAEANLSMQKVRKEQSTALVKPDVENAIQERVVQEAAQAQELLSHSDKMSGIISDLIEKVSSALACGRLTLPEEITSNDIKNLAFIMELHSKLVERAIKTSRLAGGQPTEILGVRVGMLLEQLSDAEMLEASKSGDIPRRLRARVTGADSGNLGQPETTGPNTSAIDVEYEEADIEVSDAGKE